MIGPQLFCRQDASAPSMIKQDQFFGPAKGVFQKLYWRTILIVSIDV